MGEAAFGWPTDWVPQPSNRPRNAVPPRPTTHDAAWPHGGANAADGCGPIAHVADQFCGPDVTSALIKSVDTDLADLRANPFRPTREYGDAAAASGYTLSIYWRWREGGPRDWKGAWKAKIAHGCPNGPSCIYTFTLCDRCVKADVPGNIGGSAVVGSGAINALHEVDPEDARAGEIGDRIRRMGVGAETLCDMIMEEDCTSPIFADPSCMPCALTL